MVGMILKTFNCNELRVRAFRSYVLPRIDYCSTVCSPYLIKSIDNIESVQIRFTKKLLYPKQYHYTVEGGSYEDRLSTLSLVSFEMRRFQRDLFMVHKIYQHITDLNFSDFFTLSQGHGGPCHRLSASMCKTNQLKYSFSRRILPVWNSIPTAIVNNSHSVYRTYVINNPKLLAKHLNSVVRRLQ